MTANTSGDIWQSRQMPFQTWKKRKEKKVQKALLFGSVKSCRVGRQHPRRQRDMLPQRPREPPAFTPGGFPERLSSALHFSHSAWMLESKHIFIYFFSQFWLPPVGILTVWEGRFNKGSGGFHLCSNIYGRGGTTPTLFNEVREDSNTLHRCQNGRRPLTPQIHQK